MDSVRMTPIWGGNKFSEAYNAMETALRAVFVQYNIPEAGELDLLCNALCARVRYCANEAPAAGLEQLLKNVEKTYEFLGTQMSQIRVVDPN